MPHTPILVVEDDPTVSRFIGEALARLEVDAVFCPTVEAALGACERHAFALVITDLTFPGASGQALIEHLQPRRPGAPRVLVFSAGLHQAVRERMTALGVHQCLAKPASVPELVQAVRDALNLADWPDAPQPDTPVAHPDLQPFELAAIETYFDGDRGFYETFRASCTEQFKVDLQEGDTACAGNDAVALRRVAHSLKSVLQTLGYADHSVCAKAVEQAAQHAPWDAAQAAWADLRGRLVDSFNLSA